MTTPHRVAWITDPHLNFLRQPEYVTHFGASVVEEHRPQSVILTGDIAEHDNFVDLLNKFNEGLRDGLQGSEYSTNTSADRVHLYFVLGNHDAYGGGIASARKQATRLSLLSSTITYLTIGEVVELTPTVALVGHDGWYDARHGYPVGSTVDMNDFYHIAELTSSNDPDGYLMVRDPRPRNRIIEACQVIADRYAEEARVSLRTALAIYPTVVFATHVPPFIGSTWHDGATSNDNYLPWFSSKAMGDMLAIEADNHPHRNILVLCGHTHGEGEYQARPNLRVLTGAARYGMPAVCKTFDFT